MPELDTGAVTLSYDIQGGHWAVVLDPAGCTGSSRVPERARRHRV